MLRVLPYKRYSKSAKAIVRSLNGRARFKNAVRQPRRRDVILNWGHSNVQFNTNMNRFLNKPDMVAIASNKLSALRKMKEGGVKVPDFTTDIQVVKEWLGREYKVLARRLLRSHSGNGIDIIRTEEDIRPAPLYVKYHKKTNEYRVHVFNGRVIDAAEKKARRDRPEAYNNLIRTHNNGWVYCRDGVTIPDTIKAEALKAVQVLGLDFGAVDVIMSKGNPIVLEVNTAPGLEGTTLQRYVDALWSEGLVNG